MLIEGRWVLGDDGVERPVIEGEASAADGSWRAIPFLVDTGADRTVLSADVIGALGLPPVDQAGALHGFGGAGTAIRVATTVRLPLKGGGTAVFRGPFTAAVDPENLDMSLLGRDVTDHFAAIVDRPGNVICLVGQRHGYRIVETG
jgi:hypothetical protein